MSTQYTALGGTLVRWAANTWAWSDHTPAPAVRDLTASRHYNFRVRAMGSAQYVEVPVKEARSEADLRWVVDGGYQTAQSGDHAGMRVIQSDGRITRVYADADGKSTGARVIPMVYLVPAEDWDAPERQCIGAEWDVTAETEILAKASALGWRA